MDKHKAQPKASHALAVAVSNKTVKNRKGDKETHMFQHPMLDGGSPAIAELVQQAVLLNGQALIEAVQDPTVSPDTHAGLDICVLCATSQLTCIVYVCVNLQKPCMNCTL